MLNHFNSLLFLQVDITLDLRWSQDLEDFITCDNETKSVPMLEDSCDLTCQDCMKTIFLGPMTKFKCIDSTDEWIRGVGILRCNYSGQSNVSLQLEEYSNLEIKNGSKLMGSPTFPNFLPIYRIQSGCHGSFEIPFNPGSTSAKCRWKEVNESPLGTVLSEDCQLTFELASDSAPGYKLVSIVITSGQVEFNVQFYIFVYISGTYCGFRPNFEDQKSCIAGKEGDIFQMSIQANEYYYNIEYYELTKPSTIENYITVNNVTADQGVEVAVSLPEFEYLSESLCLNAIANDFVSSLAKCIQWMTISNDSIFIIPNDGKFDHDNLIVWVEFTNSINIDEDNANVYLKTYHNNIGTRIFLPYSERISIVNGTQLQLDFTDLSGFHLDIEYRVEIDEGFLQYDFGCRANLPALSFTFVPKILKQPLLEFTYNPSTRSSNTNITISWSSVTVNRMDSCILWTLSTNLTENVNCEMSHWQSDNSLSEGFYILTVNSNDNVGNSASYQLDFSIDRTAPEAKFSLLPPKVSNLDLINRQFEVLCLVEECTIVFFVQNSSDGDTLQEKDLKVPGLRQTGVISVNRLEHLGTYLLTVFVFDLANNWMELQYEWTVDIADPEIILSNGTLVDCYTFHALAEPLIVDDHNVSVSYLDEVSLCTLSRTWYAEDIAGNTAMRVQNYSITNPLMTEAKRKIFITCDSSSMPMVIPPETIKGLFTNCFNPEDIITAYYHESTKNFPCSGTWTRIYTAINMCQGLNHTFEQLIKATDICPPEACYRNTTDPRGVCIIGDCFCESPYYGDNCEDEVYPPLLTDNVTEIILTEMNYLDLTQDVISGTEPFGWNMHGNPEGMIIEGQTGRITWNNPKIGNYSFTVEVSNAAGSDSRTISLTVNPGYMVQLSNLSQTTYPNVDAVVLSGFATPNLHGVPVKIALRYEDVTTFYDITTTSSGEFLFLFRTGQHAYGSYQVTAFHPSLSHDFGPESLEWKFLGFKAVPDSVTLSGIAEDSTFEKVYHNIITVTNDGPMDLNNLRPVISGESQLIDSGIFVNVHMDNERTSFAMVNH